MNTVDQGTYSEGDKSKYSKKTGKSNVPSTRTLSKKALLKFFKRNNEESLIDDHGKSRSKNKAYSSTFSKPKFQRPIDCGNPRYKADKTPS